MGPDGVIWKENRRAGLYASPYVEFPPGGVRFAAAPHALALLWVSGRSLVGLVIARQVDWWVFGGPGI
jgi:hypothetical protein